MIFFVLDRLCLVWWWGARPGSLQWWSEQCSVLSRPGTGAGYCGLLDIEWARVQLLSLRNNIHWRPCVLVWITIYCLDIHFICGNTDVYVMWTRCARGWVAGSGLSLYGADLSPPPSPLSLWVSVIVMCQWGQHRYTPACSSQPELASLYTTQSGREEADKPCCLITAWLKVDRVWVWDMYCLHWQTKWEVWIVKLLRYFPSVE